MYDVQLTQLQQQFGLPPAAVDQIATLLEQATTRYSSVLCAETDTLTLAAATDTGTVNLDGPDSTDPVFSREPTEERAQVGAGDRYEDLGLLGVGAMGEVRRVRDRDLGRVMAMKIIHAGLMSRAKAVARFIEEAQCQAQMQHPGLVPVHELGKLADGRFYFTMAENRGRTLTEIITEVHAASAAGAWQSSPTGWTFRGLIDAFHRVCEAMAYAHNRGVIHRDLKPDNIMLGAHGEAQVVDWGLAKVIGRPDRAAEEGELEVIVTDRSLDDSKSTRTGSVAGTPAYMPPEQALGEIDKIDSRSDVYAMGAILYEILSGRSPYKGANSMAVLRQVLSGPPEPPGTAIRQNKTTALSFDNDDIIGLKDPQPAKPPIPEELLLTCNQAMERDPGNRHASAMELAREIASWLDGARRREQALSIVNQALTLLPIVNDIQCQALKLDEDASAFLEQIAPTAPEEEKRSAWAMEDEAIQLRQRADHTRFQFFMALNTALQIEPRLPEGHAVLAERHMGLHKTAVDERSSERAAREYLLLRTHTEALPANHETRIQCAAYLKGDGALTLVTDPPGAEVILHRYELRHRRLVPVLMRKLGRTPLHELTLPMGSYLCMIRAEGRPDVRYPISIGRGEHWDGVPPGERGALPIWLPPALHLGPTDCYVPSGWFICGGDPEVYGAIEWQRLWVDGMVIQEHSVTNQQYVDFLNHLLAQGGEAEALRHVPRPLENKEGEADIMCYERTTDGRFKLGIDHDGDPLEPDVPVSNVAWGGAQAYAEWMAAETGLPWRLPGEFEWEKAARGVDGRRFPWGDFLDPSWTLIRESYENRIGPPGPVHSHPVDFSPFGVRQTGGNIRNWCGGIYDKKGPRSGQSVTETSIVGRPHAEARHPIRGGGWQNMAIVSRCANRNHGSRWMRIADVGIRVTRSLAGPDKL